MYYFYVLYSLKDGQLYKGFSSDLGKRFLKHAQGATTSTKHRRPLVLIYTESYSSKTEAMARERWSKSMEGGTALVQKLMQLGILDKQKKLTRNI
jgi:putative endonuclease